MALTQQEAAQFLDEPDIDPVPRVEWEPFFDWLCGVWETGMHVSIVSPTGSGKTHLIRYGLLPCWQRYPVLIIQFKPKNHKDASLRGLGRPIDHFPNRLDRLPYDTRKMDSPKWDKDPEWFRLQLPSYRFSSRGEPAGYRRARDVAGGAMDRSFWDGGWVLVVDEVRAVAEHKQPSLGLEPVLENAWQRGRTQPLTIVAATQQPANVPSSFYDQPSFIFLGKTLDVGRHERLAEIGGDTPLIKATLPTLDQHEFLFIQRSTGEMCRVQAPPAGGSAKVAAKK